jgi:hypothetical protein
VSYTARCRNNFQQRPRSSRDVARGEPKITRQVDPNGRCCPQEECPMDPDNPRDLKLLWRTFLSTAAVGMSAAALALGGVLSLI